jgi:exportin-T
VTQIISLAFVADFPERWPTFFDDLLATLNQGHLAVGMYLKVLLAIDQEVVDRDFTHSSEVRFGEQTFCRPGIIQLYVIL